MHDQRQVPMHTPRLRERKEKHKVFKNVQEVEWGHVQKALDDSSWLTLMLERRCGCCCRMD